MEPDSAPTACSLYPSSTQLNGEGTKTGKHEMGTKAFSMITMITNKNIHPSINYLLLIPDWVVSQCSLSREAQPLGPIPPGESQGVPKPAEKYKESLHRVMGLPLRLLPVARDWDGSRTHSNQKATSPQLAPLNSTLSFSWMTKRLILSPRDSPETQWRTLVLAACVSNLILLDITQNL